MPKKTPDKIILDPHVSTETLFAVIRSTPNVADEDKEYLIAQLKRRHGLHVHNKTASSFLLGIAIGELYRDSSMDKVALQFIIEEIRDTSKLPFVDAVD